MDAEPDHISVEEFSRRSGLAAVTVRRYVARGKLPAVQPGGRGHRVLISVDALAALLRPAEPTPTPSRPPSPPAPRLPGRKPGWMGPATSEQT